MKLTFIFFLFLFVGTCLSGCKSKGSPCDSYIAIYNEQGDYVALEKKIVKSDMIGESLSIGFQKHYKDMFEALSSHGFLSHPDDTIVQITSRSIGWHSCSVFWINSYGDELCMVLQLTKEGLMFGPKANPQKGAFSEEEKMSSFFMDWDMQRLSELLKLRPPKNDAEWPDIDVSRFIIVNDTIQSIDHCWMPRPFRWNQFIGKEKTFSI